MFPFLLYRELSELACLGLWDPGLPKEVDSISKSRHSQLGFELVHSLCSCSSQRVRMQKLSKPAGAIIDMSPTVSTSIAAMSSMGMCETVKLEAPEVWKAPQAKVQSKLDDNRHNRSYVVLPRLKSRPQLPLELPLRLHGRPAEDEPSASQAAPCPRRPSAKLLVLLVLL